MADAQSENLGKRIRQERLQRQWKQKELAARIGVTELTVIRWEKGQATPRPQQIERLTEIFGRPPGAWGNARQIRWNVPLRNRYFTGRERLLEDLHHKLAARHDGVVSQVWGLTGLAGIGKTAAAIEYIYRYGTEYEAIFWISGDTSETLLADFTKLAFALDLPVQQEHDQQRIVSLVKRWLEQHGPWLLIFDNADDLELVSHYWPGRANGSVLLTTRSQATGSDIEPIEVDKMSREEGIRFLLRRIHRLPDDKAQDSSPAGIEQEEAGKIWECMDGLPLALDQAACYLDETRCTLDDYLELFETSRKDLLKRRGKARGHPEPVAVTWLLALDRIEQGECPAAAELLHLCAFLHADAMPESMIRKGAQVLAPALQSLATKKTVWNEAIAELHRYSLVKRKPWKKILTMHRLVQDVIRDDMPQEDAQEWAKRARQVVSAAFPKVEHKTWEQCEQLLPHVRQVAQHLEQLGMMNEEAGHLIAEAARYLRDRARYAEAESLLLHTLHVLERRFGKTHSCMISPLNTLASLYLYLGKYEQAEAPCKRAFQLYEQHPEYPRKDIPLHIQATIYMHLGNYTLAESLYLQALQIRQQELGEAHPDVATTLNNLAVLYTYLGKYKRAGAAYQQARPIYEQQREYLHLVYVLSNLGELYIELSLAPESEPLFREALEICKQQLDPEHHGVAFPINGLGHFYFEQGNYTESESLYQKALQILEACVGPEHPDIAGPLHGLANVYREQGDYAQAERFYERAVRILELVVGREHPETARVIHDLARLQEAQKNYEAAKKLYLFAFTVCTKALGGDHPQTIATRERLMKLLDAMGLHEEAALLEAIQREQGTSGEEGKGQPEE